MRKNISPILASGMLLIALALTGCGGTTEGAELTSASTDCVSAQPNLNSDTPTIAVLGQVGPKLASYDEDIETVVGAGKANKARIIVNGVSGDTRAPNLLTNVVMVGEGDNNLFRENNLKCKAKSIEAAIARLKDTKASKTFDAFSAMSALAGNLENNPSNEAVDVVLLTPLASVGGDVDLTDDETLADPVAAINRLAGQGLVPACKNWRIYAVAPATGLDDVRAAQLKEFWRLYVDKCGGQLVAWTGHLATFPLTETIGAADTSLLEVERSPEQVTATLGSDLLFGADSAVLQANAEPALRELLALTIEYHGKIRIIGHTNPVSATPTDGVDLSKQRAGVVKAWLVAHQVRASRITTIGKGSTEPVYAHPKTVAQAASNRRVVAVIYVADA